MVAETISIDDHGRVLASVDVVAGYLGLTPRRVQQLEKSRGNLRCARGLYDLKNFVRCYCEQLKGEDSAVRGEGWKEKTRLDAAKASLAELDLAEREGELVNAEAQRKQDFKLARILRNNLQSMPDRISALVAAEGDEKACHRMIADEVNRSLLDVLASMESVDIDEAELDVGRSVAHDQLADSVSQETDQEI